MLQILHDARNPLGVIALTAERLLAAGESDELLRRLGQKPLDTILRSVRNVQRALEALGDVATNLPQAASPSDARASEAPAELAVNLQAAEPRPDSARAELTAEVLQTIGLAFVHELVRMHGGDVRVSNHEGAASTFRISIPPGTTAQRVSTQLDGRGPVANAAATALQQALRWLPDESVRRALEPTLTAQQSPRAELPWPERMRPGPSEGRILLAEDNADLREYVEQLLGERWTVEATGDGEQALQIARERPPDLVLADIMMPGIDGLTLVRALRANTATATTPILLLSAQAGREARMEGELAGADDYLVKPFSARELIARVALHLEIGRVRTQLSKTKQGAEQRERLHGDLLRELSTCAEALHAAATGTAHPDARAPEALEREAARITRLAERLRGTSSP